MKDHGKHQKARLVRIAGIVLAALLCVWCIVLLYHRIILIYSYNFNIEGVEELFAYLILKIPQGQLYTDPEQYPFIVTQYPPIYLYLMDWLPRFTSLHAEEPARAMYITARWFNLVCNVLSAGIIYDLLRKHTGACKFLAAVLSIAVFQLFTSHHLAVRPDSLKILFLVLLYYNFAAWLKDAARVRLLWMIIFGTLAVLTKQDALIHVGGISLILWMKGQFKQGFLLGFMVIVLSGLALLPFFNWDIHLVHKNLVMGIAQGVDWKWLSKVFWWNYPAMVLLPVLIGWMLYKLVKDKNVFVIPGLLVIVAATYLSLLKWGSNFNYLAEVQLLVVLFVIYQVLRSGKTRMYAFLTFVLVVFYASNHIHNYQYVDKGREAAFKSAYQDMRAVRRAFLEQAQAENGLSPELITFDRPLSLIMIEHTFIGTLVNEYPEIFFETAVHKLPSVPEKSFDYRLECSERYMKNLYFICASSRCPMDREWLDRFKGGSGSWEYTEFFRQHSYTCYRITCPD